MNSRLFKNSAIHSLQSADDTTSKLIYAAYFVAGLFFLGSSLFTLLQSITLIATQNGLPGILFPVLFIFIFIQFLLGYGLIFCRRWILVVLSIHVGYSLVYTFLLLPYFNLERLMMSSAISTIPFIVLLCFIIYSKTYCTGKLVSYFAIIGYCIAFAALIVLNIMFGESL